MLFFGKTLVRATSFLAAKWVYMYFFWLYTCMHINNTCVIANRFTVYLS